MTRFEELRSCLQPKLRRLALRYRSYRTGLDEEDLLCEMELHLWAAWKAGEMDGKTESYAVQSCYFHLRNRLRLLSAGERTAGLDEAGGDGERVPLRDRLPDNGLPPQERAEGEALYEKIMGNGLSRREKDIVRLLCEGFTVREIGAALALSHAMVVKYKKSIARKVTKRYGALLV